MRSKTSYSLLPSGKPVAIVSVGLRGESLRPDLTTVPLEGVEPSRSCWRRGAPIAAAW